MAASNDRLQRDRGAFTLVELLVVITIIGILVALLLPAVQVARESSRRAACQNNLKQLGLGILQHESALAYFPSGGWGFAWAGDPNLGSGVEQPGGWWFSVLPYIDQGALYQLGAGQASGSSSQINATTAVVETPLPIFNCPTRRISKIRPAGGCNNCSANTGAKSDYVGNGGDNNMVDATQWTQPGSYTQGQTASFWVGMPPNSGVCLQHTALSAATVRDGLSNTYLLGEKYLQPELYETGNDLGDNESMYTGLNWDTFRTAGKQTGVSTATTNFVYTPPLPDTPGVNDYWCFGSAHLAAFSMAFCDGSVRSINYAISPETHRRLCNRADLLPIDSSTF